MSYITAETIKTLRERQNLTQRQLADRLCVSDKAISKWKTGRGLPDLSLLPSLAAALGVSTDQLLHRKLTVNRNPSGNMKRAKFYVCPLWATFFRLPVRPTSPVVG